MVKTDFQIEAATRNDYADILSVARNAGLFTSEEVEVVDELITKYYEGHPDGYRFLSCRVAGKTVGFSCYGQHALTSGTYDLYWIAVDKSMHGRGLGRALSRRTLEEVKALGGRMLIAETSGLATYAPTRAFYDKDGWKCEATITDFYAPGDDLVIYIKRV